MTNVRFSILSLACAGLISTAGMSMAAGGSGTSSSTDPMDRGGTSGQNSPAMGSEGHSSPGMESQGQTSPGMGSGEQTAGRSIEGEILRVQGENYVVKDSTGAEVNLHVDESTEKSGSLKKGDRIEAEITSDGHAFSVKKAEKESAH
jgi:uncharacterized protein YdeI (BOF family)